MNNIFKNAYFGKAYRTKDGRKAIFIEKDTEYNFPYLLIIEGDVGYRRYDYTAKYVNDMHELDIISEWQEINEEELDKLAGHEYPYEYYTSLHGEEEAEYKDDLREAFKAGYRKAMEEKL